MALPGRIRRSWLLALPVIALLCWLAASSIVSRVDHHNNDFFTFWLAGHMLTQGSDPYAPEEWLAGHHLFNVSWIPNPAYVYPLPLALLFVPFGLLPLEQAFVWWVTLSLGMLIASLLLLCPPWRDKASRGLFVPLLAGCIFFRPVAVTMVAGQVSAWLLFTLTAVLVLWEKGKWEWGALLLPLLVLKPNLGAPLVTLLALWLFFQRRYRALLSLAMGGLVLLLAGMLINPAWVLEYWSIGSAKLAQTFGYSPTVWGLASLACGFHRPCTLAVGGIAAALLVAGTVWLLIRRGSLPDPHSAMSLAVTVTLLITPYTWTYDQILLILPIIVAAFSLLRRRGGFLPGILLLLTLDLLAVAVLLIDTRLNLEIFNALIPLCLLAVLLWSAGLLRVHPASAPFNSGR
jgi:hypothetical protein